MPLGFSRDVIVEKLEELGRRLDHAGERAELYIVGGAAMALVFTRDRVTRDIDAVFIYGERSSYACAHDAVCDGVIVGRVW